MSDKHPDFIEARLLATLSQPPSAVGRRLRTEEELAGLFNVGRWRLRAAIGRLVDAGVLVRQRGSGTYVKVVPQRPVGPGTAEALRPEQVFADMTQEAPPTGNGTKAHKALHLCLWADQNWQTDTARLIHNGIVIRAAELGHQLAMNAAIDAQNKRLTHQEIRERLLGSDADAHIVVNGLAGEFAEILKGRAQVVAFGGHTPDFFEPSVLIDTDEVIGRSVAILQKSGFERIGLVALKHPHQATDTGEQSAYRHAVGGQYQAEAVCPLAHGEARRNIAGLFAGKVKPDALVVADDFLLDPAAEVLDGLGLVPGRDVGVITLSNLQGHPLPAGANWSRMEFDTQFLGQQLVDAAVRAVESKGTRTATTALLARWLPGETHLKSSKK